MFHLIPLTQGLFAKVDDKDFERVNEHKWYAWYNKSTDSYYAHRAKMINGKQVIIKMHRFILGVNSDEIKVDHKSHDTLDNRRSNLRKCTHQQNNFNRKISSKNNTSGYKGVYWYKPRNKWRAYINKDGKQHHLGLFTDKIDAAKAYNEKAKELFGKFAYLNVVVEEG